MELSQIRRSLVVVVSDSCATRSSVGAVHQKPKNPKTQGHYRGKSMVVRIWF